jgi:hypothetical protein
LRGSQSERLFSKLLSSVRNHIIERQQNTPAGAKTST